MRAAGAAGPEAVARDGGQVRRLRWVGAALGFASGPAAGFGQAWAGTGDGRWFVWVLASLIGAVLGALTLPLFYVDGDKGADGRDGAPEAGPGAGFGAMFALSVGLVAGAFAAFPMGAVMGGFGGLLGGAVAGASWRRVGVVWAALLGAGVGFFGVWLWTGAGGG